MEPLEHGVDQITVKVRDELRDHVGHQEPKIVSDQNAAMLARQLAIHTDVSIFFSSNPKYAKDLAPQMFFMKVKNWQNLQWLINF